MMLSPLRFRKTNMVRAIRNGFSIDFSSRPFTVTLFCSLSLSAFLMLRIS